ncbi:hypothetical protein Riv7116_0362 [Rivularia sp. PCC 7116]|uniref:hypothetical protein n=1 Tax=Rivularia sp. PCC 7116 TaxID=373994 RepID=UPI00029ECD86|nr:hypothetical protein [Rivularia sp. PCC 7116]AFY52966.1 hypothetical protein Riv7116_0362 [Rivularia sp. PCC 7116]
MNIFDLNQIAVVEGSEVIGGGGKYDYKKYYKKPKKYEKAVAKADADAIAFGDKATAKTYTSTTAVAGEFAAAESSSYAAAKNKKYYKY